jgi:UDP-N-acetylmuramoylalanine--D-glutamate ligase
MMDLLSKLISGKRVLLLGFGKEGQATYKMLKNIGLYTELGIADIHHPGNVSDAVIYSGEGYLDHIDDYDVVFKSPGVVLPKDYREYACKITSQTEIFLQAFNRQVIGITGTKGKSTVSSLLYHVLHTSQVPCIIAGNIGTPVFEIAKDVKPETVVVLEISCHQLEICEFSPAISVLLNLYEDHLDRYKTFENYVRAKKNIYLHQHPLDVLYCDKSVMPSRKESKSRTIVVERDHLPFQSLEEIDGVKLRGSHNLGNCAFVYSIAKSFGITDEEFIESLKSYTPLHHRLELIGSKNGVDYYDDSISTTVESTINAIESIPNVSTVLLGGMDRGIDYTGLVSYLARSRIANVICMYESGKRIYEMLKNLESANPKLFYCMTLYEAAAVSEKYAMPGTACILSPASASYGDFKNFEERGDVFKSILFKDVR